uniref:V-SNARE coiled-coil homology domain-containing protein n=63 Tax=Aves TaxID=8782 RepID=A0A8C0VBC1_CYACU
VTIPAHCGHSEPSGRCPLPVSDRPCRCGHSGRCPQVVDIMRVNVDKVLERDQKLSELDDRADALQAGASQFETSAAKLKRKYWWKNLKVQTDPKYPEMAPKWPQNTPE